MEQFVAVNFKLGNYNYDTICHVAMVKYKGSDIIDKFESIINPNEDYIDPFWVKLLGIDLAHISDYPMFADIYPKMLEFIDNNILVYHMGYNLLALNSTCERYALPIPELKYVNSEKIVRRTWIEALSKGYGMASVSRLLKLPKDMNEAERTGCFVIEAMKKHDISLNGLIVLTSMERKREHISGAPTKIWAEGNPDGHLYGETIVITGDLASMFRKDLAKLAAEAGCNVKNSIARDVTTLVVGVQHRESLRELGSDKYNKVVALNDQGYNIRIICEKDFLKLLKLID